MHSLLVLMKILSWKLKLFRKLQSTIKSFLNSEIINLRVGDLARDVAISSHILKKYFLQRNFEKIAIVFQIFKDIEGNLSSKKILKKITN